MKTLVLPLYLVFSLLATCCAYAGNTSLTATYPASNGSYNKIMLENPQPDTDIDCSKANHAGLLFMDPSSKSLAICANGQATLIAYPETCFNRFWVGAANSLPGNCPNGYTQATSNKSPMVDSFQTPSGNTVNSTVCCGTTSSGSTSAVGPT